MNIVVEQRYSHFKGHIYKTLAIAKDSEDLSIHIVYQNIDNKDTWVRSYENFSSKIDKIKYPDVFVLNL